MFRIPRGQVSRTERRAALLRQLRKALRSDEGWERKDVLGWRLLFAFSILAALWSGVPLRAYTPTEVKWNPPGDPYGSGSPSNQGLSIASPYSQSGFTITYNGYAEEDSHTLVFGTHWSGQVGVNFVRGAQAPDNTVISFARGGAAFWLNEFNIDLDATSVRTLGFQGFKGGEAVTDLVTFSGLGGGSNNFRFADPVFADIDELRITADSAIRGFLRETKYHATTVDGSHGNLLSPGDIAILAVSSIHYDFAFIALADLPGDHYIFFTTAGWNSGTASWLGGSPALTTAGYEAQGFFWKTPPAGVTKGAIVNYLNAPGQRSTEGATFLTNETTYLIQDQILVFEKADVSTTTPSFIYAANFSDTSENASGFQTTFAASTSYITGVPAGLTAAASGQVGSAFGLAPANGYDSALKTGVLVNGMTREQVLQAIHTPVNWEVYSSEDYEGFALSGRYPASITIATPDTTAPTVVSVTRLTPAQQITAGSTLTFRVTYSEAVTNVTTASFAVEPLNGATISASVTEVSGTGTIRDVTVTVASGTGELRLNVVQ